MTTKGELDALIVELLKPPDHEAAEQVVEGIYRWWQDEKNQGEDFTSFLLRRGVLTEAAPMILDLVAEGTISGVDLKRVFTQEADGILRSKRASYGVQRDNAVKTTQVSLPSLGLTVGSTATRSPCDTVISTTEEPKAGVTLGRCLLIEKVGEGASGLVFRAFHKTLNIPVAIKILRREIIDNTPGAYQDFQKEARLLARLSHPNVVRVWDFEDDPSYPYLVLEYVEGLSLAELIARSGRLQPEQAIDIISQVTDALRAAADLGIVHRDVKPANILVTRSGDAKLADLGLAAVHDSELKELLSSQKDSPGSIVGTVAYMAPEQANGNQEVDLRSDIYALGATFYHAITGRLPHAGKTIAETLLRKMREQPIPPHEVSPDISPDVSRIISRMMATRPEERYASYAELKSELRILINNDQTDKGTRCRSNKSTESKRPEQTSKVNSMWQTIRGILVGNKPAKDKSN